MRRWAHKEPFFSLAIPSLNHAQIDHCRSSHEDVTIDYRREDGRFPAISNPESISSSATGVNRGIKSWKEHWSEWAGCQNAIRGIYFTKKSRAETLQHCLELDFFKPWLEAVSLKGSPDGTGFFLGGDRGFWKKKSRLIYNGTNVASQLANLFVSSHW